MRNIGTVEGNYEQAKPIIIGKDTVYIHTDINPAVINGETVTDLYTYNEVQYGKDEYIELMNNDITDTQLALCEIFESLGGAE